MCTSALVTISPVSCTVASSEFSVANHIDGVRLRARATGKFSNNQLDLEATLKNVKDLTKKKESKTPGSDPGTDSGSNTGSDSGNQSGSDSGKDQGSDSGDVGL